MAIDIVTTTLAYIAPRWVIVHMILTVMYLKQFQKHPHRQLVESTATDDTRLNQYYE